ncbi:MAG TPA: homoserine kinase [Armatimonadetes bacterium]|nr:homoserine kinase [Armatimonadota bacterium]
METRVTVTVPATTANLGPGFDSLGLALGLYNRLEAEFRAEPGWHLEIVGAGADTLPRDETNIVVEAMQRVFERGGNPPSGVRLRLTNEIPLARGLGSSAAARVAGLAAANALAQANLSEAELLRLAAELEGHPDNVVPAVCGGFTVTAMAGSQPLYVRFDPPSGLRAVIAVPDFELPTAQARAALPETYSRADAVHNLSRTALVVAALASERLDLLRAAMEDRIHQPYRLPLIPGAEEVLAVALEAGALGVALSGAGPTLLALTAENAAAIAQAMQSTWAQHGIQCTAREVGIEKGGLRVVSTPQVEFAAL